MTDTTGPGLATRWAPSGPGVLAVHGTDPATGRPRTWHLTPRLDGQGTPAGYRLDLADGEATVAATRTDDGGPAAAARPSQVPTQRS